MPDIPPYTPGHSTLEMPDPAHPQETVRDPGGAPSGSFAHQTPGYERDRLLVKAGIRAAAWVRERPDLVAAAAFGVASLGVGLWMLYRRAAEEDVIELPEPRTWWARLRGC